MTFHINTTIKTGSHRLPSEGSCTMEIACLAAGFNWHEIRSANDLPECMSRVIGAYVIRLNDAMSDDQRQRLMAFVPRLTTTRGTDAEEQARAEYLVMNAAKPAAVATLRSAGLMDHADKIAAAQTIPEMREAAWAAKAADVAAWATWAAADAAAKAAAKATWAAAKAAAWAAKAAAWAAAEAAEAAAWAAEAAGEVFDWTPYLDALDGTLRIGPQADVIDEALIRDRVRVLVAT